MSETIFFSIMTQMQIRTNSYYHQGCKNYNIDLAVVWAINRGNEQLFENILLFSVTDLCHCAHICSYSYDEHVPSILVPLESVGFCYIAQALPVMTEPSFLSPAPLGVCVGKSQWNVLVTQDKKCCTILMRRNFRQEKKKSMMFYG